MLNSEEVNVLGNVINHTWGKSSTVVSPSMSITCSLEGDVMIMKYVTIISLVSSPGSPPYRDQCKKYEDESVKASKSYLSEIKKEFKTGAGRALKCKQLETSDGIELLTLSPHHPRKTAYYRRTTLFSVD